MRSHTVFGVVISIAVAMMPVTAQQPAPNIVGWHGAEWGMSVEQVKSAVGMDLTVTTDGSGAECKTGTPGSTLFKATTTIEIKSIQVTPKFCITDKEGLVYIVLDFGTNIAAFDRIKDELIGSYGQPTSEHHDPPRPPIVINSARWVLPKTQIEVSSAQIDSGRGDGIQSLSVSYSRRKPIL